MDEIIEQVVRELAEIQLGGVYLIQHGEGTDQRLDRAHWCVHGESPLQFVSRVAQMLAGALDAD